MPSCKSAFHSGATADVDVLLAVEMPTSAYGWEISTLNGTKSLNAPTLPMIGVLDALLGGGKLGLFRRASGRYSMSGLEDAIKRRVGARADVQAAS